MRRKSYLLQYRTSSKIPQKIPPSKNQSIKESSRLRRTKHIDFSSKQIKNRKRPVDTNRLTSIPKVQPRIKFRPRDSLWKVFNQRSVVGELINGSSSPLETNSHLKLEFKTVCLDLIALII